MAVVFRPWALAFFADQGGGRGGRGCTYFTHNRSLETVDRRGGGRGSADGLACFYSTVLVQHLFTMEQVEGCLWCASLCLV